MAFVPTFAVACAVPLALDACAVVVGAVVVGVVTFAVAWTPDALCVWPVVVFVGVDVVEVGEVEVVVFV